MDSKWEYYWPKGLLALPVIFVKLQSRSAEGLGGHWGQWAIKMQFHYLHSVRLREWRVASVRVASWDPFPVLHTRKGKVKMTLFRHVMGRSDNFFLWVKSACLSNPPGNFGSKTEVRHDKSSSYWKLALNCSLASWWQSKAISSHLEPKDKD